MDCICPRPAALKTVNRVTCPENLGQIQRLMFQRSGYVFDSEADPTTDITLLASWTPLLTAAAGTKVVITPYIDNLVIPQAEAITRGGNDNTTLNGVEQILGYGGITATGMFTSVPVAIIEQLRDLMCEPDLVVYMINQYGRIVCQSVVQPVPAAPTQFTGIPIQPQTFGVSYPDAKGFATLDEAGLRFGLSEDWAKGRVVITPAFNIKTQLLAPLPA